MEGTVYLPVSNPSDVISREDGRVWNSADFNNKLILLNGFCSSLPKCYDLISSTRRAEVLPLGGSTTSPYSMVHYTTLRYLRDTFGATLQPHNISSVSPVPTFLGLEAHILLSTVHLALVYAHTHLASLIEWRATVLVVTQLI